LAKIAVLILLSACYALVTVATGLGALWAEGKVGPWALRLWPVVIPFLFGWIASMIGRGRMAGLALLIFLAPALEYSCALLVTSLLGHAQDPVGVTGHLQLLAPHMLFAGAGALAWTWNRSRARQRV
jgi:hypothetical protein